MSEFLNYNPENNETLNPSQEIANKLRDIGEEFGFDEETCDEIAEMEFEDALEAAYGYLMQAGLDADEILSEFMYESEQSTEN